MGEDVDFFYFPTYASKPEIGKPVLGAGTLFTITKDSKAARAFIEYLKMPLAHELWMADGGFLTPLKSANPAAYANDAARKQGEIMATALTADWNASMKNELAERARAVADRYPLYPHISYTGAATPA